MIRKVNTILAALVLAVSGALALASPIFAYPNDVYIFPGTNLSTITVSANTTYYLADYCSYNGTFNINQNNVLVTTWNYSGSGCTGNYYPYLTQITRSTTGSDMVMSGSHDEVMGVAFTGSGDSIPSAWNETGVDISGNYDIVYNDGFKGGLYSGVTIEPGVSSNQVNFSSFIGIDAQNPTNSAGVGPYGVLIKGSNNTVGDYDSFSSIDTQASYGWVGTGVQIQGNSSDSASNNLVEDATAANNSTFADVDTTSSTNKPTNNEFFKNTVTGSTTQQEYGVRVVGSGASDGSDGNTFLVNNIDFTNGPGFKAAEITSSGWQSGDGTLLTLQGNDYSNGAPSNTVVSTDGGCVGAGGNVVESGTVVGSCLPDSSGASVYIAPGTNLGTVSVSANKTYFLADHCIYNGTFNINADHVLVKTWTDTGSGCTDTTSITRSTTGSDMVMSGNYDTESVDTLSGGISFGGSGDSIPSAWNETGVDISGNYNIVDSSSFGGGLYNGVKIEPSGWHNHVDFSQFSSLDALNPTNSADVGPYGVYIGGGNNTVWNSTFQNINTQASYGWVGTAVQVQGSSSNSAGHNLLELDQGYGNNTFAAVDTLNSAYSPTGTEVFESGGFGTGGTSEQFYAVKVVGSGASDGPDGNTFLIANKGFVQGFDAAVVTSSGWQSGDGTLFTLQGDNFGDSGMPSTTVVLSTDGGCVNGADNAVLGGSVVGGCL